MSYTHCPECATPLKGKQRHAAGDPPKCPKCDAADAEALAQAQQLPPQRPTKGVA